MVFSANESEFVQSILIVQKRTFKNVFYIGYEDKINFCIVLDFCFGVAMLLKW